MEAYNCHSIKIKDLKKAIRENGIKSGRQMTGLHLCYSKNLENKYHISVKRDNNGNLILYKE